MQLLAHEALQHLDSDGIRPNPKLWSYLLDNLADCVSQGLYMSQQHTDQHTSIRQLKA